MSTASPHTAHQRLIGGVWQPAHPFFCTHEPVLRSLLLDTPPPDDPGLWATEAEQIARHNLAQLALDHGDSAHIAIDATTRTLLQESAVHRSMRALGATALGAHAIDALTQALIPFVVTKGVSIAKYYDSESQRPFTDLDVVVHPRDFRRAMSAVESAGFFNRKLTSARGVIDTHCREGINLVHESGASVDIHHEVPPWIWGRRISFDGLLARSIEITISGRSVRIASREDNLQIAALHIISDQGHPGGTLRVWRDIAILARGVNPEQLATAVRDSQLGWLVGAMCRELGEVGIPADVFDTCDTHGHPSLGDRIRLRLLLPPSPLSRTFLNSALRLPLWRAIVFVVASVFPSHQAMQDRGVNNLIGAWRRSWRRLIERIRER